MIFVIPPFTNNTGNRHVCHRYDHRSTTRHNDRYTSGRCYWSTTTLSSPVIIVDIIIPVIPIIPIVPMIPMITMPTVPTMMSIMASVFRALIFTILFALIIIILRRWPTDHCLRTLSYLAMCQLVLDKLVGAREGGSTYLT